MLFLILLLSHHAPSSILLLYQGAVSYPDSLFILLLSHHAPSSILLLYQGAFSYPDSLFILLLSHYAPSSILLLPHDAVSHLDSLFILLLSHHAPSSILLLPHDAISHPAPFSPCSFLILLFSPAALLSCASWHTRHTRDDLPSPGEFQMQLRVR